MVLSPNLTPKTTRYQQLKINPKRMFRFRIPLKLFPDKFLVPLIERRYSFCFTDSFIHLPGFQPLTLSPQGCFKFLKILVVYQMFHPFVSGQTVNVAFSPSLTFIRLLAAPLPLSSILTEAIYHFFFGQTGPADLSIRTDSGRRTPPQTTNQLTCGYQRPLAMQGSLYSIFHPSDSVRDPGPPDSLSRSARTAISKPVFSSAAPFVSAEAGVLLTHLPLLSLSDLEVCIPAYSSSLCEAERTRVHSHSCRCSEMTFSPGAGLNRRREKSLSSRNTPYPSPRKARRSLDPDRPPVMCEK